MLKLLVIQRKAVSKRKDLATTALAAACWCGLVGFLFHGLADFGWRLPANLVYATILLALLLHCLKDSEIADRSRADSKRDPSPER